MWTILDYPLDSNITMQVTTARWASVRAAYIKAQYGVEAQVCKRAQVHLDFGGCVLLGKDTVVEVPLGKTRVLTFWRHQIPEIRAALQRPNKAGDGNYCRVTTWLHHMIFLSPKDKKTVLKAMEKAVQPDEQAERHAYLEQKVIQPLEAKWQGAQAEKLLARDPSTFAQA